MVGERRANEQRQIGVAEKEAWLETEGQQPAAEIKGNVTQARNDTRQCEIGAEGHHEDGEQEEVHHEQKPQSLRESQSLRINTTKSDFNKTKKSYQA